MTKIPARLSTDQCDQYRLEGFLVLPQLFGAQDLKQLAAAFQRFIARAGSLTDDHYEGVTYFGLHRDANPFARDIAQKEARAGVLRRITYPYAFDETINALRRHPAILGTMRSLLGDDVVQLVNQMNFNPPSIGTGWGWHQDYRFRKPGLQDPLHNYVQCLIALDECNEVSGGLRLIPRSHELGALKLDLDPDEAEARFRSTSFVTPELAPGDGVIFNPFVVHGSTPNRSDHERRVFINGYACATHCDYGKPVLRDGTPDDGEADMEYEHEPQTIAKASKY